MALGLAPVRLATLPMCMTEGGEVAKRCGQYRVDASTQPTTRGQNMVQSEPLSPPFSAATPPEQTPLWHRFRLFIDQSKNEPDPYFSTSTCPAKRSTAPRSCGSTTTALVTPATSTAGRSGSDPRDQSSPSRDPGLGRDFFVGSARKSGEGGSAPPGRAKARLAEYLRPRDWLSELA